MLPDNVQITEEPDGVVLVLRRDPQVFRRTGWILIASALGVCVFAVVIVFFFGFMQGPVGFPPFWLLVPFGLVALACLGIGAYFIRTAGGNSTTRIGIDALALTVVDRFAWMKRRETVSRASIRSFIVEPFLQSGSYAKKGVGFFATLGQIRVLLESGESKRFAYGYSREVLGPVVAELARLCGAAHGTGEATVTFQNGVPTTATERVAVRVDRPANSKVQLEEHSDGVTFVFPPAGIWRGSMGLFPFGLLWTSITSVICVLVVAAMIANNNVNEAAFIPFAFVAL